MDFQFSLGWTALVTRFIGAANAKRALSSSDSGLQVNCPAASYLRLLSRPLIERPALPQDRNTFRDQLVVSIATGLVSVTSRASMTVLVIGGVVRAPEVHPMYCTHDLNVNVIFFCFCIGTFIFFLFPIFYFYFLLLHANILVCYSLFLDLK